MKALFDNVSFKASKMVTHSYSTSFSLGVRMLHQDIRNPICGIYGFVRFADEIVDTFHGYDRAKLLEDFRQETYKAIEEKISLNPILNSFQHVVHKYNINIELVDQFLHSMEMDLDDVAYTTKEYEEYILGSAEVVGLMCLKVFTLGNEAMYQRLTPEAMKLGSAFQKINFLRDLKADYIDLGRTYFPNLDIEQFDEISKKEIEADIEKDFKKGYEGIQQLPKIARFGVYMAYVYYYALFRKIKKTPASKILKSRIRVPNQKKYSILFMSYLKHSFNII